MNGRPSIRDSFINNSLVQTLTRKMKNLHNFDSDEAYMGMGVALRLSRTYKNPENTISYIPKGNVVCILIPLFQLYL